jgi:putative protein kinase ArgK-like GTPase of G3E family
MSSGRAVQGVKAAPERRRIAERPTINPGDNMVDTKLIAITGVSGAGKSTTAQNLACQYQLNHLRYRWLHEEINSH